MLLDEQAINEISKALIEQGWRGSREGLSEMLTVKGSEASIRAFMNISKIVDGSMAHSRIVGLASKYKSVYFNSTAFGIVINMSNPEIEGEAACYYDYGSSIVRLKSKDQDDEDFLSEQVSLKT